MRFVWLVLCLLLVPICTAQTLSSVETTFDIGAVSTLVTQKFVFAESGNIYFEILIPSDATNISVRVSGKQNDYFITKRDSDSYLTTKVTALTDYVEIEYTTMALVVYDSNTYFIANFLPSLAAASTATKVILPERAVLAKPTQQFTSAIYPPGEVSTDGQRIIVTWLDGNITQSGVLSYMVIFNEQQNRYPVVWIPIVAVSILVGWLIARYFKKRKPRVVKRVVVVREKGVVVPGLKENEQKVVEALKLKGGRTTQATLRVATDMAKATLSAVIKELEVRGIIHKEKRGNKNIVTLKEGDSNEMEQKESVNEPRKP